MKHASLPRPHSLGLLSLLVFVCGCGGGAADSPQVDASVPDAGRDVTADVAEAASPDPTEGGPLDGGRPEGGFNVVVEGGLDVQVAASSSGTVLWQGFEHEWLRTVAGFAIPHRISLLQSYPKDIVVPEKGALSGTFVAGQSTGVDGNYMKPVGHFSGLRADDVYVVRGEELVAFTDDASDGDAPLAYTKRTGTIVVPHTQLGSRPLTMGTFAMLLDGIDLNSSCDDAKQPPDNPCNSNGMWPYRIWIGVGDCGSVSEGLSCPYTVEVGRAWTPENGGGKPMNDKLDISVRLRWVALARGIRVTTSEILTRSSELHDDKVPSVDTVLRGTSGGAYTKAAVGVRGLGFTLSKLPSQTAKKFDNLGRYIGTLRYHASLDKYDPASGQGTAAVKMHVWVPDTTDNGAVKTEMDVVLLQLGGATAAYAESSATLSICRNSQDAPLFSQWTECGKGDKGPERTTAEVAITVTPQ